MQKQSQGNQQLEQRLYTFDHQTIHYNNGRYQGSNNSQLKPQGIGIAIDDQFNFFISQWKQGKINGKTMINFVKSEIVIFGQWRESLMKGLNTIKIDPLTIYCKGCGNSRSNTQWENPCVIEDSASKLIYVAELHPLLNSPLPQIRILNRISNNHHNLKSICGMFKIAMTQIMEDPLAFLEAFTEMQSRLQVQQCINSNSSIFFGYKASKIDGILTEALGIQLALRSGQTYKNSIKTLSLGSYNKKAELHGIGMSTNKSNQEFVGFFKDGLMTKQFSVTENLSSHRSSHRQNKPSFPSANSDPLNSLIEREVLRDIKTEHLKSINFLNSYLYFPALINLKGLILKIQNYLNVFQSQLKKHNPKAQDTFMRSENQEFQSSNQSNSDQFNRKNMEHHKYEMSFNQKAKQGFFKSQANSNQSLNRKGKTQYENKLQKGSDSLKAKGLIQKEYNSSNKNYSLSDKEYRSSLDTLLAGFQSIELKKIPQERERQFQSSGFTKQAKKNKNFKNDIFASKPKKQQEYLYKKQRQIKNIQILNMQTKHKKQIEQSRIPYFASPQSNKKASPNRKPGFIYSRSKPKRFLYQDTGIQVSEVKKSVKNNNQIKNWSNNQVKSKSKNKEKAAATKNNTPPKTYNHNQVKKNRSPLKSAKNNFDDLPTSRVEKKQVYFHKNSPSKQTKDYITWQS